MARATSKQGAVLIVDALGTRGIWAQGDPVEAVSDLGKLAHAFQHGISGPATSRSAHYRRAAELSGVAPQMVRWRCQSISDSVIATAQTNGSLGTLLLYVALEATPLIGIGFEARHPFRGAISVGTYYESKHALIGPAVDEAAEWYDKANWAGVVLTPSASDALSECDSPPRLAQGPAYVQTMLPLKDGPLDGDALNWPLDTVSRRVISAAFARGAIGPDVARKRANTLAFFDKYHV